MEFSRGWQETWRIQNASDQGVNRCIYDWLAQLLNLRNKCLQMFLKNCGIDALDRACARRKACNNSKEPLQTRIDHEGARLGIHASSKKDIDQVLLLLQSGSVVHLRIRHHLRKQHDGRLRVVGVHIWHVQVVYEKHALFVPRGAISPAGALVKCAHNNTLQCEGAGVAVVVDRLVDEIIVFGCEVSQEVFDNCRLPCSCDTNIQHGFLSCSVQLQNVLHAFQVHVADYNILEHSVSNWIVLDDVLVPANPLFQLWFKAEVVAFALVREPYCFGDALHEAIKGFPVIDGLVISYGTTYRPHHSEREHCIEHCLLIFSAHAP
mmetsp:Transcript_80249/g.208545  ORF Transcript_80249/g.208545 Transcript_80249/m.208545 type:complete len:321 (-) Transcript_80249:8568-9530(-)